MSRAAINDPSNADASPLLDGWGWDSDIWSAADWITWHRAMKAKYGATEAASRLVQAFTSQSFAAKGYDYRSFNSGFRDYFRSEGILETLYDGAAVLAKPIGAASDVLEGVSAGVSTVGRALSWGVPVLLVGAALIYFRRPLAALLKGAK